MGRHRAPDPDDSDDDPFAPDGFETDQFEAGDYEADDHGRHTGDTPGAGTPVYREDHPAGGYNYSAEYSARYPGEQPEHPADDRDTDPYGEARFGTDDDYDDYEDEYQDDYDDGVGDRFGYAADASSGAEPPGDPQTSGGHRTDAEWTGSHRTVAPGRRGVSVGVIVALATVVAVVAGFIMWRFFGDALSDRSDVAAGRCLQGDANVAVIADSAIAGPLEQAAAKFNETAGPVGDHCIVVGVTAADPGAVIDGLAGGWPQSLGEKPALWIPASSVSEARLQAAAGPETVSNSKSLVSSPVLLAMHPDLKPALADQNWATLPNLQSDPAALDNLQRPGWGGLRLALPSDDNSGAAELAAEAVAAASAPPGAPATAGAGAAARLRADAPELTDDSLEAAMTALLGSNDPAAAPVHAVVTTEQRLIARATDLADAKDVLTSWVPPGPVAVADFPAVLLAGDWLGEEQAAAASEFERFMRRPEQLTELSNAGFRVDGGDPPTSAVTTAAPIEQTLSVGDDSARLELAEALSSPAAGAGPAVSIMLDRSLNLAASVPAINARIAALPPTAAVGLTTFDGTAGNTVVNLGGLGDDISGQSRRDLLTSTLSGVSQAGGAVSFTTLRNVYADALANFKPGQPNSVLVITSGPHTDQSLGAQGLQDLIRGSFDPARPVAVDVINVGADPDRPTWESVAQLSGGTYQNVPASDSPEFAAAVNALLA
ncbi:substrate-binding domain-containing protein [[Mycobacterium] burgundiense]|uniref:Substrate-binding domain-containing protein n=1 Tax=[Mycobacterium] burgundiense TaxID=3064286 RepID=A0ABM9LQJ2_9MYCO|nr:substrate-binding domain-containing protein [Mycolicibacterium sp. MU0053]CAJ1503065.1 substrate-binding domain-containing protein [Mycolicibacterium sp. MU0053]